MAYSKQLVDQFTHIVDLEYNQYCALHQLTPANADFITYLVDRGILSLTTMKHFTILEEFKKLYPEMRYHKTNTVKLLAHKFHLSERSVWAILKNNLKKDE